MSADRPAFTLATEPQQLLTAQLADRSELAHLADARLACVFCADSPLMLRGHPCAAFVGQPSVQGPFASWFAWFVLELCHPVTGDDGPDFVIMFDPVWWGLLDAERRDRLVYHELLHIGEVADENGVAKLGRDGRPLLHLVPHDRELFDLEILRYGTQVCDHGDLADVIVEGDASVKRRQLRALPGGRR